MNITSMSLCLSHVIAFHSIRLMQTVKMPEMRYSLNETGIFLYFSAQSFLHVCTQTHYIMVRSEVGQRQNCFSCSIYVLQKI